MLTQISMYFLRILKEEIVNLLGEIKKIVPEAGVPSVNSGQAL
jgi:hypothetical protein